MSAAEVARRVGNISERTARYRIGRLVKDGVIQISTILDPRMLGFTVIADVFTEVEKGYIEAVATTLAGQELVSYVACSIGERDVSVQILAHDNEEVYAFATGFIGKLPRVRKTTTSIVPIVLKDVYKWRIPDSACVESTEQDGVQVG